MGPPARAEASVHEPDPLSWCAMRRESRGSGGRLSGCRRRIQSADARTIGARLRIGYGTTGERAIREMQIIGGGRREVSTGRRCASGRGVDMTLTGVLRGNPSWTSRVHAHGLRRPAYDPVRIFSLIPQHAVVRPHVWQIEFLKIHTPFNRTKQPGHALPLTQQLPGPHQSHQDIRFFKKQTNHQKRKPLFLKGKSQNLKIKTIVFDQINLLIFAARFSGLPPFTITIFNFRQIRIQNKAMRSG